MSDTPAILTLRQAAEAVGRSKQTLLRAIQSGKLSAQKDDLTGEWRLQAAELFRLYPPGASDGTPDTDMERDVPAEVIGAYQDRIEAMERSMERERRQYEDTIADLRRRLDSSEEERRRKDAQLTALLEDQRRKAEVQPIASAASPRQGFWASLFGRHTVPT